MRKYLLYIFMMPLLLLFSGCSAGQDNHTHKMKYGSFYLLSDLYKNNKIDSNDLLNISYRNNGKRVYNEDGEELYSIPEAILPVTDIDQKTLDMIISDFFDFLIEDSYFKESQLKISDIQVEIYCGLYNGYYALRFKDNKTLTQALGEENLGGYKFIYPFEDGNTVVLWKQT